MASGYFARLKNASVSAENRALRVLYSETEDADDSLHCFRTPRTARINKP
jgi:hypothetical protein